ncbi:hypothetical protein PoB_003132900 [Plakobranchus ocellatus]|uniref:Uncharacterized protein n=1 Tax=Plakobranchus ocellatus TaxID=259542 RepID=A0AAV4AEG2_9GAST|nr:hypothetical protein PoB_003132900 [Plakobranchus ocellatus]
MDGNNISRTPAVLSAQSCTDPGGLYGRSHDTPGLPPPTPILSDSQPPALNILLSHFSLLSPTTLTPTPHPTSSPQQGDLRLSGPPSGQGAGGGARTRDRKVPSDLRADSLATVPPTPHFHRHQNELIYLSRCAAYCT